MRTVDLGDRVTYRRLAYLPDRRSTRVEESLAITVSGFDSSHNPYHETVSTLSVSCHGCRYLSENRVGVGDMTILELVALRGEATESPALARIRSVKLVPENPMALEVAVELALPRNIWGVASPPEDWAEFEFADATEGSASKPGASPTFAGKRAQMIEARPTLVESLRTSRFAAECRSPVLPPLLAYPTAIRQPAKAVVIQSAGTAATTESSNESLDELCSRLESKARQIFAGLIASFAEEISGRSSQSQQTSPLEVFESAILGFEGSMADPARRSA